MRPQHIVCVGCLFFFNFIVSMNENNDDSKKLYALWKNNEINIHSDILIDKKTVMYHMTPTWYFMDILYSSCGRSKIKARLEHYPSFLQYALKLCISRINDLSSCLNVIRTHNSIDTVCINNINNINESVSYLLKNIHDLNRNVTFIHDDHDDNDEYVSINETQPLYLTKLPTISNEQCTIKFHNLSLNFLELYEKQADWIRIFPGYKIALGLKKTHSWLGCIVFTYYLYEIIEYCENSATIRAIRPIDCLNNFDPESIGCLWFGDAKKICVLLVDGRFMRIGIEL